MKTAAQLFREADAILFDFDGPICAIFAGYPASRAVEDVIHALQAGGYEVSPAWHSRSDPHNLLQDLADTHPHDAVLLAEKALTEAEVLAAGLASPTSGVEHVVAAISPRPWVVVSNNAEACVRAYLRSRPLMPPPAAVFGRPNGLPARMKPDPWLINQAVEFVGAEKPLLIGDSVTDISAALNAGVPVLGYANKPGKRSSLADAGANAVFGELLELVNASDV